MIITEKKQDLLYVPKEYVIAHCISSDCVMGKGIAKQISMVYPDMKRLIKSTKTTVGKSIKYQNSRDGRIVYNLVTKFKYFNKPTYATIESSLIHMRKDLYMLQDFSKKLAMPKIGCGLDEKDWNVVLPLIQQVFNKTEIEILICYI